MLSYEQREDLLSKIERVREDLVNDSVAAIYARNPFWLARYGEASTKRSKTDAHYNLNYLISAIRLDLPSTLSEYYRWLRGILVYRGMCSDHLRDTLDITGQQMARLLPDQWPVIEAYYRAAYDGLTYSNPACQILMERRDQIAQSTADRMFDPARTGKPEINESARARCVRDNLYHLSYLADAVEVNSESIFQRYREWVVGFLAGHNVQPEALHEALAVLGEEISTALPEEHAAPFVNFLQKNIAV